MGKLSVRKQKVQCEEPHYGAVALGGLGAHPKTVLVTVGSVQLLIWETCLRLIQHRGETLLGNLWYCRQYSSINSLLSPLLSCKL